MIRKSEFIIDTRPIHVGRGGYSRTQDWKDWLNSKSRPKERWLMSVIELLLKNKDWSGAYLLIRTYISTVKSTEGTVFYNRTPFDESVTVRAMRQWFWSIVEEHGYALPEEEIPYDNENTAARREIEKKAEAALPFVGGKPRRRYSEATTFFQDLEADRKKEQEVRQANHAKYYEPTGKPTGRPKGSVKKHSILPDLLED